MSTIAHNFYTQSPLLFYPLIALLIFIGVFVAVSVRAIASTRGAFDDAARLPLEDNRGSHHE